MNLRQLWRARAAHARQSAQQTRNEGQRSLLLLYAEECERKAEKVSASAEAAHPILKLRLSRA